MNIVLTIIAVVAAAIGAGLWWWRTKVGQELALMLATETANARDVAGKAAGTLVELKGTLRASELIVGEFSGKEAIYVRSLTERDVESTTTDSDGSRKRERRYETASNVERHAPAELEDASGRVRVLFEGAAVEALQVHQRYEAEVVGGLIGDLLGASGSTRGYRYTEWIIEAGTPVYVLGSVVAGDAVGKNPNGQNPFVISIKSEEERTRSLGRTRIWLLVGTIVALLLGVGFLYLAISVGAKA